MGLAEDALFPQDSMRPWGVGGTDLVLSLGQNRPEDGPSTVEDSPDWGSPGSRVRRGAS